MIRSRQFVPAHSAARRGRFVVVAIVLIALFAIPQTRSGIRHGVAAIGTSIARAAHSVGGFFGSLTTAVRSKQSLLSENENLKSTIEELNVRLGERDQLARENADLKASMGRSENVHFTLAAVLGKPPHSVYDTLLIDGGTNVGLAVGQAVYANGETPIGTIAQALPNSALVRLYSAPGEKSEARLSMPASDAARSDNIDVTLVGEGGGNFSTTVPHDLPILPGTAAMTKEINPKTLAVFKKITSDSRDPFQALLLAAPININELRFVEVKQ